MKQAEKHYMEKHRQNIYKFSEQSSVQMMYSPVMYDNSIRMEQISHIKTQPKHVTRGRSQQAEYQVIQQ